MAKLENVWRRPELLAVTDYAEDYITLFDRDFRHLFVNRKVAHTLGRTSDELIGKTLAQIGMPAELCDLWQSKMLQVVESGKPVTFDSRMVLPNGSSMLETLLAPVKDSDGATQAITAITRDVTSWKRDQALRNAQNEVMRELARGASLTELMGTMVRLSEQNAPGRLCSLLLLSEDGRHLVPGCAPQLPEELIHAICARPIGPDNASCGAAAYHKHLILADDLTTHGAWAEHRALARKYGLHACWSQAILSADGALLGTFAMYHKKPRPPNETELLVVHEAALLAAIAIPHCREHESLLENETRYRMLTENAANIVIVNDAKGIVRYVSPAVEPILGYTPGELIGRPASEFVHPDDLPEALGVQARLRSLIGSQNEMHYRYRHKNGSWRQLDLTAKSSLDHRGAYIAVISARDVTESAETTRALRESEERLERAMEASRLGMWDWNVETGELYVDGQFSQTLGYSREEVEPDVQWLLAHIHPDDRQRVSEAFLANLQGKTAYTELEYRGQANNGDYRWDVRAAGSRSATIMAGRCA